MMNRIKVAISVAALLAASGCSVNVETEGDPSVPGRELADQVATRLHEARPHLERPNVACPSSGLQAKVGASTICELRTPDLGENASLSVYVTATAVEGKSVSFDVKVANPTD